MVAVAGDAVTARRWGAEAIYSPPVPAWQQHKSYRQARLVNIHDRYELAQARRNRADAVIISPVFPTRTHPGAATLGRRGFLILGRSATMPVIALGGMNRQRARGLRTYGWGAIDGLS
jgi:thiamine-phosphate pyrophosphorylase